MKKLIFLSLCCLLSVGVLTAQKYAHLNFGSLLSAMPATTAANDALELMQTEMVAEGEKMAKEFTDGITQFRADQASGNFTPVQLQAKQKALETKQQTIAQYEQTIANALEEEREKLLTPIITSAEAAIAKVAKAQGYAMVFDTSMFNAVLFAEESVDITEAVKKELGIE